MELPGWAGVVVSINPNVLPGDSMFEPFFGQLLSSYLGRQNAHKAYFTFQDGPPK